MIELKVINEKGDTIQKQELPDGRHSIGKATDNNVVLLYGGIWDYHADLIVEQGKCTLCQKEEEAEILINQKKMIEPEVSLRHKDTFQLGDVKIKIEPKDQGTAKVAKNHTGSLTFLDGGTRGEETSLDETTFIGRSPKCDVQVTDNLASRQHAKITLVNGEYLIEDLQSSNGTLVNQQKTEGRVVLFPEDIIQICNHRYEFRIRKKSTVTKQISARKKSESSRGYSLVGRLFFLLVLIASVGGLNHWQNSSQDKSQEIQTLEKDFQASVKKIQDLQIELENTKTTSSTMFKKAEEKTDASYAQIQELRAKLSSQKEEIQSLKEKIASVEKNLSAIKKMSSSTPSNPSEKTDPIKTDPEKTDPVKTDPVKPDPKLPAKKTTEPKPSFSLDELVLLKKIKEKKAKPFASAKVVSSQKCGTCHSQELKQWERTPHFKTFSELRTKGKSIMTKMGLKGSIKRSGECMNCHFTTEPSGSKLKAISGVSCESCHGPAQDWLFIHNDYQGFTRETEPAEIKAKRHAKSSDLGMNLPENTYAVIENCYRCHSITNEKLVNIGGHTSGTGFEAVAWSQGMVRHNFLFSQENKSSSVKRLRMLYLVGSFLSVEYRLRGLAKASDGKKKYAQDMMKNFKKALNDLNKIKASGANVPEIDRFFQALSKTKLSLSNREGLTILADKATLLAMQVSQNYDGSKLTQIDKLLPQESAYKN